MHGTKGLNDRPGRTLGMAARRLAEQVLGGQVRRERDEALRRLKTADEARMRAERDARAHAERLAFLGHEVRTPLLGILGHARLLRAAGLDGSARRHAETVQGSAEALLAVVDDILDLACLENTGHGRRAAAFRLAAAVEGALGLLRPQAEAKGLALSAAIDPALPTTLAGDAGRLRQVLVNLIGNAIRFTDAGQVTVTVAPAKAMVRFTVADTGIGIPSGGALFQAFASPRRGGTGLGLAICKRLVEGEGGRIGAEGAPGLGSRFWFELPLREAPPVPRSAMALAILLADDDAVGRRLATAMLTALGHRVTAVCGGAEALAAAQSTAFDLLLLDVRMPGLAGPDVARAVRALPGPAGQVPILALTAAFDRAAAERCRAAGIDRMLLKPLTPATLAAALLATAPAALDPERLRTLDRAVGPEAATTLARDYLDSHTARIEALARPGADPHADELARLAHALRGGAGSFGFSALAAAARDLDRVGRTGDAARARALVAGLPALLTAARAALELRRPTDDTGQRQAAGGV